MGACAQHGTKARERCAQVWHCAPRLNCDFARRRADTSFFNRRSQLNQLTESNDPALERALDPILNTELPSGEWPVRWPWFQGAEC